jgi:hypothetical protein
MRIIASPLPVLAAAMRELAMIEANETGSPVRASIQQVAQERIIGEFAREPCIVIQSEDTLEDAHISRLAAGTGAGILVLSATPELTKDGGLRCLLSEGVLDARRIACFGARRWRPEERDFIIRQRVQSYSMLEMSREGLTEMTDAVMAYVRNWPAFHLVLNLNVIDAAFAPGLRNPVPGGLSARETLYVLQRLRLIRSLASVEIIVGAEPEPQTVRLLAHIIAELS